MEATERVVRLAGLPAGLEGLRILHVSDTHFPADGASLPRFLETVSGLEFDLVLASGDYVETSAGWETAARGLTSLAARWGVYATLGGARLLRAGADGGGVGVVVAGSGAGGGGVGSWIRRRS